MNGRPADRGGLPWRPNSWSPGVLEGVGCWQWGRGGPLLQTRQSWEQAPILLSICPRRATVPRGFPVSSFGSPSVPVDVLTGRGPSPPLRAGGRGDSTPEGGCCSVQKSPEVCSAASLLYPEWGSSDSWFSAAPHADPLREATAGPGAPGCGCRQGAAFGLCFHGSHSSGIHTTSLGKETWTFKKKFKDPMRLHFPRSWSGDPTVPPEGEQR